jgi:hypothetical protein
MTRRQTIEKYVPYPLSEMLIHNAEVYIMRGMERGGYLDDEVDGDWCCDSYGDVKIYNVIITILNLNNTLESYDFWSKTFDNFLMKNL